MQTKTIVVTQDMLASKGKRFGNYLIDLIPQYAVTLGLPYAFFYIGEFTGYYALSEYWYGISTLESYIFAYGTMILYYFIFEATAHRTLGKYATNTKVIMIDGSEPTNKAVLIRTFSRLIPFEGFSFLGTDGKGWHDSIAKTYVVDIDKFEARQNMAEELEQIGLPLE